MENLFTNTFLPVWVILTIGCLLIIASLICVYFLKNTPVVTRIRLLGKNFIFFPKDILSAVSDGAIQRYTTQYTKDYTRSLMNEIIRMFNADSRIKTTLNQRVLNYKFGEKGLEYDFMLYLSLSQAKYLMMGVGLNEATIDEWLKRLNLLISNRYISKSISQEARNVLIAELIKRFTEKAYPDFRFKNVFYEDFVRDLHLVQKIEPILEQALMDLEVENMLIKMDIKQSVLFKQPTAKYRLWIYQHAVLCRNWIK